MERVLLALTLLVAGCAPLPRAEPFGLPLSQRVRVEWQGDPGAETRRSLLAFVDQAELVYRARFGGGPVRVRGLVFEDSHLLTARVRAGFSHSLLGYVTPGGVIHLPWRGVAPGRAIVHELHHLAEGRGRPGHNGAGWRAADLLGASWWQEFWLSP